MAFYPRFIKKLWKARFWKRKRRNVRDPAFWARLFLDGMVIFLGVTLLPVLLYKVVDPPTTPLMWIRWAEGGYDAKFPRAIRRWRPLSEISPRLIRAVISSEDQKFFNHSGFDWEAVSHAIQVNLETRRKIGASTISMQTARNVFLWQNRDWVRKGLEAYFTVLIEFFWGKKRILEVYFNVIEWGDGIFGCEAATRRYFKHSVKHTNASESAWLAAILPNPRKWSRPHYHSMVEKRKMHILHLMPTLHLPFTTR